MKKFSLITILTIALMMSFVGCSQYTAKQFGGTVTVDLPQNKKLINATWKDSDLWYLLRESKPGESPETIEFIESSTLGIAQGKVIFHEH